VRSGSYTLAAPADWVPEKMRYQSLACISPAGWMRTRFELYAMPLRERLPVLALPLRDSDPRVTLDLQALLAQVYTAGRYSDLDYTAALDPPLPQDDQTWLQELLRDPARSGA